MFLLRQKGWLILASVALIPMLLLGRARSSDHADTPEIAASPGTDISDVYVFPSPTNPNNVVLAMNVRPIIPQGQSGNFSFDPNVLYQFKIDNTGDSVEDLVIQMRAEGTGAAQVIKIAGPSAPTLTGTNSVILSTHSTTGVINTAFSPSANIQVFAGAREDSFFFDLERFFAILPDRATPINGIPVANPNTPLLTSWRDAATAQDFLSVNGLNVLSVVVELPKTALLSGGNSIIRVWCTTSL